MNRRYFLNMFDASPLLANLSIPRLPHSEPLATTTIDPIWHVLNRTSFGPTPGQVEAVRKTGLANYLALQLDPIRIGDELSDGYVNQYMTLTMSVTQMLKLDETFSIQIKELEAATVLRAVYSRRQLFEVLCLFWSEHFSILHFKEQDKYLKTIDDRTVIRKHALGNFRDLLGASAHSPAMLVYLDNAWSHKDHSNENYARELMELHTLGVGNYSEQDVLEVARCFTGWSILGEHNYDPGGFVFVREMHDNGSKTVLGHDIPAGGGVRDGEMVLDLLAAHPMTAHAIATKLCRRFISDDPPAAAISAAQQAFSSSGGAIPSVLMAIFNTPEFTNAAPKFKRPFEYLISILRALDTHIDNNKVFVYSSNKDKSIPTLLSTLTTLGHMPFNHPTPEGYSDNGELWEQNMLLRWNAALDVVQGSLAGVTSNLQALIKGQGIASNAAVVVAFFAQHLYGRALTDSESALFMGYLNAADFKTTQGQQRLAETIGLMLAAPAFQWR